MIRSVYTSAPNPVAWFFFIILGLGMWYVMYADYDTGSYHRSGIALYFFIGLFFVLYGVLKFYFSF